MTHKRNARAPRPDPAAQDPMDYLLDDVMQATDKVATELREMADLEADPLATLAGHCHTLAGRVAALAEVVRQMRDLQRGLVVISDPPMPAPVLMPEANLEDELEASRPRRWTRAEALAEAEQLGGMAGAVFLMHWEKTSGGA